MANRVVDPKYVQKSLLFLVPLVIAKRNQTIVPKNSYISDDILNIRPPDGKLLIAYGKLSTRFTKDEFSTFEESYLIKNRFFRDFYETPLFNVYMFDLKHVDKDYQAFLSGSYSKFSVPSKDRILNYFSYNNGSKVIPHSKVNDMLNPTHETFQKVAHELNVDLSTLLEIGEIVDKPDIEKETMSDIKVEQLA